LSKGKFITWKKRLRSVVNFSGRAVYGINIKMPVAKACEIYGTILKQPKKNPQSMNESAVI